jgi:hypothetical protein
MRRALAKDGRLALSTWRSDEEIPFFRELRQVGERQLGEIADQRYSLGDAGALEKLLRDAGFHEVRVRTMSRIIRFEDGGIFVRMNAMALVGMSDAGKTMTPDERKRAVDVLVDESSPVLRSHSDDAGLAFELSTNLAIGRA